MTDPQAMEEQRSNKMEELLEEDAEEILTVSQSGSYEVYNFMPCDRNVCAFFLLLLLSFDQYAEVTYLIRYSDNRRNSSTPKTPRLVRSKDYRTHYKLCARKSMKRPLCSSTNEK